MKTKNFTKKIRNLQIDFSIYDYLPFAILVLNIQNKIIFYNQESDLILKLSTCSEYEFKKLEFTFNSSLNSLGQDKLCSEHKISFNNQTYTYNVFPVYERNLLKYKIIILFENQLCENFCKELNLSLTRENNVLKKIIDSSYDGIYITDGDGKTLYFNDAFIRISGFKREEALGKKVQDLVAQGYLPKSCSWEVIKQRKAVSMTIDYPNGIEGMLSGNPVFDENGNLIRTILNVRDMSELNRLNEELKNATSLTASYKQQLKEVQLEFQKNNDIIYKSEAMKNVINLALKVSTIDAPVLILGESGCGKDVIAKFIHDIGDRFKKGNFLKINCGAIPETLLESELFGYEKGAFTGAINKGKFGLLELAHHGTFFLDEIGDLPLNLQVKLLDVLQEKKIKRLGGTKYIPVDVRIIAATNKNLEQMIEQGKFRLDLFYRLNVIQIRIPPLRERSEDIVPLIKHFLEKINKKYKTKKVLSPQSLERLLNYNWPGNVRELYNVLERSVVTTEGKQITLEEFPVNNRNAHDKNTNNLSLPSNKCFENLKLKQFTDLMEKQYIAETLQKTKTLKEAAYFLGIDISTLVRKKQKYGI